MTLSHGITSAFTAQAVVALIASAGFALFDMNGLAWTGLFIAILYGLGAVCTAKFWPDESDAFQEWMTKVADENTAHLRAVKDFSENERDAA